MLLYSILHLSGVKAVNAKYERLGEPAVSLNDIKRFRQLDSGYRSSGISPHLWGRDDNRSFRSRLRQQCWDGARRTLVGEALQSAGLHNLDYDVYVICGDGDMMEGVSNEAASLAGHQMLGNLSGFTTATA